MRIIPHLFCYLGVTIAAAIATRAADSGQTNLVPGGRNDSAAGHERVSFQAILVVASDAGTTDSSLAAYEGTLKRVLRFKSYRRVGGASTTVANGGETTIAIGGGYNLDVWVTSVSDREVEFGVRWFKGKLTLANTKLTRPRRSNTVIGGPATEDGKGTYAVIVTAN